MNKEDQDIITTTYNLDPGVLWTSQFTTKEEYKKLNLSTIALTATETALSLMTAGLEQVC